MDPKYKAGFYFGIFITMMDIVIVRFLHPGAFEGKHRWLLLFRSLTGGIIGGVVLDQYSTGMVNGEYKKHPNRFNHKCTSSY